MIVAIDDWKFEVNVEDTRAHSSFSASRHCTCAYCENYYRTVERVYPNLCPFIARFGGHILGPVEMYPIEPTLYLSGYRIFGRVLRAGNAPFMVDGVPVMPDIREDGIFMLEVGEMELPWVLEEDMNEVISPANEPEFLEKMYRKLLSRSNGSYFLLS